MSTFLMWMTMLNALALKRITIFNLYFLWNTCWVSLCFLVFLFVAP